MDCIFCKIVAGEVPAVKVFEDDACVAFMDIGPVADGHVLLIPKNHAEAVDDMSPQDASAVLANLPAIVRAVRSATGCQGVNVLQNNGRAAGQAVMHVHFHIIPRTESGRFHFNWPAADYPPGRMDELAAAIRQALARASRP